MPSIHETLADYRRHYPGAAGHIHDILATINEYGNMTDYDHLNVEKALFRMFEIGLYHGRPVPSTLPNKDTDEYGIYQTAGLRVWVTIPLDDDDDLAKKFEDEVAATVTQALTAKYPTIDGDSLLEIDHLEGFRP
jgi:hypothetical protein